MSRPVLSDIRSDSVDASKGSVTGRVVSNTMKKTVTIVVERKVKHPLYKKYVRRSTKLHAHDEGDECNVGDWVAVVQCRPLSKTKAWRVNKVLARAR